MAKIHILVLWVVTPCSSMDGDTYCLLLQTSQWRCRYTSARLQYTVTTQKTTIWSCHAFNCGYVNLTHRHILFNSGEWNLCTYGLLVVQKHCCSLLLWLPNKYCCFGTVRGDAIMVICVVLMTVPVSLWWTFMSTFTLIGHDCLLPNPFLLPVFLLPKLRTDGTVK